MAIDHDASQEERSVYETAPVSHFVRRKENKYVALIAVDSLPEWIHLVGVPKTYTEDEVYARNGVVLFDASLSGTYELRVVYDTHASSIPPRNGIMEEEQPQQNQNHPVKDIYPGTQSEQKYEPTTPGVLGQKKYCTHWIRTGECDFMQQGCMFLHCIPDPNTLELLGYKSYPRWFREMPSDYQQAYAKDFDPHAFTRSQPPGRRIALGESHRQIVPSFSASGDPSAGDNAAHFQSVQFHKRRMFEIPISSPKKARYSPSFTQAARSDRSSERSREIARAHKEQPVDQEGAESFPFDEVQTPILPSSISPQILQDRSDIDLELSLTPSPPADIDQSEASNHIPGWEPLVPHANTSDRRSRKLSSPKISTTESGQRRRHEHARRSPILEHHKRFENASFQRPRNTALDSRNGSTGFRSGTLDTIHRSSNDRSTAARQMKYKHGRGPYPSRGYGDFYRPRKRNQPRYSGEQLSVTEGEKMRSYSPNARNGNSAINGPDNFAEGNITYANHSAEDLITF